MTIQELIDMLSALPSEQRAMQVRLTSHWHDLALKTELAWQVTDDDGEPIVPPTPLIYIGSR